ncbi:hypothetical protein TrVE_jg1868 [Triparma verrucosa]|uniref:Uncharacterized protein n=1 Tax=Triparma verrucosa TaxID=1606542 RepID=A0A9W7F9D1_9STRA|nr:hypothetical protein TrVE_jg1868 [Triparma verrucosa]
MSSTEARSNNNTPLPPIVVRLIALTLSPPTRLHLTTSLHHLTSTQLSVPHKLAVLAYYHSCLPNLRINDRLRLHEMLYSKRSWFSEIQLTSSPLPPLPSLLSSLPPNTSLSSLPWSHPSWDLPASRKTAAMQERMKKIIGYYNGGEWVGGVPEEVVSVVNDSPKPVTKKPKTKPTNFNDIPQSVLDILTLSTPSAQNLHLTSLLKSSLLTANHTSRHCSLLLLSLLTVDENIIRLVEFIIKLENSADYSNVPGRYYNVEMAGRIVDYKGYEGFKRFVLMWGRGEEGGEEGVWKERGGEDTEAYWLLKSVNKFMEAEEKEEVTKFFEWCMSIWDIEKVFALEMITFFSNVSKKVPSLITSLLPSHKSLILNDIIPHIPTSPLVLNVIRLCLGNLTAQNFVNVVSLLYEKLVQDENELVWESWNEVIKRFENYEEEKLVQESIFSSVFKTFLTSVQTEQHVEKASNLITTLTLHSSGPHVQKLVAYLIAYHDKSSNRNKNEKHKDTMNELINSLKGTILYTNMRSYNPTVHSLISAKLDNNVFVDSGDSYAGIFDGAVALEGYVSSMISRMVKVDRVNDIISMRVNMLMTVCLIKRPESVLEDINRVVRPFNTFVRYEKYDGPCGGLCVSGFEAVLSEMRKENKKKGGRKIVKGFVDTIFTRQGEGTCQEEILKRLARTEEFMDYYDLKNIVRVSGVTAEAMKLLKVVVPNVDKVGYDWLLDSVFWPRLLEECLSKGGGEEVIVAFLERFASNSSLECKFVNKFNAQAKETEDSKMIALEVVNTALDVLGVSAVGYVEIFLTFVLKVFNDRDSSVRESAASAFGKLIRLAPLVTADLNSSLISHLIHGVPLPPLVLPPDLFAGELREYQKEGVTWLTFLFESGLGGVLSDDMGLGKTIQCLCAMGLRLHRAPDKKYLVVCPNTVVGHWVDEVSRYFPSFKVNHYMGRGRSLLNANDWNLVVTSYEVMRSDIMKLSALKFDVVALDEGHLLKNPSTNTAKSARVIRADLRVVLSGTPVQNNVNELWSCFDFLMEGFLGTRAEFAGKYGNVIMESISGCVMSTEARSLLKGLHQQVLPFILRRDKKTVLKSLPEKTIIDVFCDPSSRQRRILKSYKRGEASFKELTFLRLLAVHPCLVEDTKEVEDWGGWKLKDSGKLKSLYDLLISGGVGEGTADGDASAFWEGYQGEERVFEGENDESVKIIREKKEKEKLKRNKVVIFAQHSRALNCLEEELFAPHLPTVQYLRLDGKVSDRYSIVKRFEEDADKTVLLCTTKVGGLGLNLISANICVFLELDYNPMVDLQAMDRLHRIGQKRAVTVYRLVTRGTVEERILKMQGVKVVMSDEIVSQENSSMWSLGTDRILDLIGPTTGAGAGGEEDDEDGEDEEFGEGGMGFLGSLFGSGVGVIRDVEEVWAEEERWNKEVEMEEKQRAKEAKEEAKARKGGRGGFKGFMEEQTKEKTG